MAAHVPTCAVLSCRSEDMQGVEKGLGYDGEQVARGAAQPRTECVESSAAHDEAAAASLPLPTGDRL